jgi:hypothetical protein
MTDPINSLRNLNLNSAYKPQWQAGDSPYAQPLGDFMPQGNTEVDPFQGTQWGQYLDALGAKKPGGVGLSDRGEAPGQMLPTDNTHMEPGFSPLDPRRSIANLQRLGNF